MRKSKFEQSLDRILDEANSEETRSKLASLETDIEELDGEVAKSLSKLASVVRRVSTEPTYQDILNFIEGR